MLDTPSGQQPANTAMAVLAAIADLGAATPAAIATKVGIGYSTVNPKLRAWEDAGLAERFRKDGQTQWRLTEAGKASTATPQQHPAVIPPADATPTADAVDAGTDLKPVAESGNAVPPTSLTTPADPPADGGGDGDPTQMPTPARPAADSGPATAEPAPETAPADDTGADNDPSIDDPTAQDEIPSTDVGPRLDDPGAAPAASSSVADPAGGNDALTEPVRVADETTPAAEDPAADPGTPPVPVVATKRPKGALEASVLAVLRAHPDTTYKVNDLRKLVDQADKDTGYPKASAGAVANALDKLGRNGQVITVPAKYVTVQAVPAID